MNSFISTAYLMGGLGNQMFQIANAYSQALKNNATPLFKKTAYTPMQANQPTKYLDNIYKKLNFVDYDFETERVVEYSWNNANLDFNFDKNIEFYGYFQSSKNFLNFSEEIKNLFEPSELFLNKIHSKYPSFKNTISLHVRRGDYLSINDVLPVIDISYIKKCLSYFTNYEKLFIFSDDKEWVKENLNLPNSEIVEDMEDFEELWTMSLCENNIMSNSTFSWWGSYLNKNPNKTVLCPSIWFGPKGPQPYDNIYEPSWQKINVNYKNGNLCY